MNGKYQEGTEETEDNDNALVGMKEFLEDNYRLFTVIGVFAALSVYFTRLGNPDSPGVKLGIGSSLLLFLTAATVGVYRAYKATEKARQYESHKSHLWVLPLSLVMYSLIFLSISVLHILTTQYTGSISGVLGSSVAYFLMFVYWNVVATSNYIRNINQMTIIGQFYRFTPHFALIPTGIYAFIRWKQGELSSIFDIGVGTAIGYLIGFILNHFVFTVFLILLVAGLDLIASRLQDWSSLFRKSESETNAEEAEASE